MNPIFYLAIIILLPILFPVITKKIFGWHSEVDLTGHGLTGRMGQVRTTIHKQVSINKNEIIETYEKLEKDVLNSQIPTFEKTYAINLFINKLELTKMDLEVLSPVEGYFPKKKRKEEILFLDIYINKLNNLNNRINKS